MADHGSDTLRARPRTGAPPPAISPPTISTTQELPPPPPGRWERFWERVRTSRSARRALVVAVVVAVVLVGVVTSRGSDSAFFPAPREAATSPTPEPGPSADVVDHWLTTGGPVLADIERDIERVIAAVVGKAPALVVLQCHDSSQRVAGWSPGLVPAPDAELDRELRAALDLLGRAFATCSTASFEGTATAMEPLRQAGIHLARAQQRVAELRR
jgi:hypothetical protein